MAETARKREEQEERLITSRDQIPKDFPSYEAELEFWESHTFAPGVLEEGPEVDADLDRVLGIDRSEKQH